MIRGHKKLFASGLLSGLTVSLGLLYVVFRPGTQVELPVIPRGPAGEKAGEFSLGFQFDPLPSVSKKPRTVDELAQKIGFSSGAEAMKGAAVLAASVRLGVMTPAWKEKCRKEQPGVVCDIVEDYLGPKLMPALGGQKPRVVRRSSAPFLSRYAAQLQAEDFNLQYRRAPDWSFKQIQKLAEFSLKAKDCPRNFSLTLGRELEAHLKTPEAWALMDKLDNHGLECMEKDEPWSEPLLVKIALLRISRKMWKEAIPLLERALQAQIRKEEFRSIFWLGEARRNAGLVSEARAARELLWKNYPISWHSILSRIEDGQDPMENIRTRPLYSDEYDSGDAALDRRSAWLQLLMASEDPNGFSVRHYGEFVVKSFQPNLTPGFVQHLARLFNNASLYRLQIMALSNMAFNRPETVTPETLRLLYPRPFFEEIANERHIDSAIILGLARQESGFDPSATSRANAQGLLQILPSTARTLKKSRGKKLYDYSDNIALGSQYILKLSQNFNGSIEKTLASYNAGQTVVGKWNNRYAFAAQDAQLFSDLIPYKETREYVPNILRNAYWYHRLFPELTKGLGPETVTSSVLKTILKVQLPKSGSPKPASTAPKQ